VQFFGLAAIGAVWRDHLDAVSAQLLEKLSQLGRDKKPIQSWPAARLDRHPSYRNE
jgi:hypothetical protein